MSKIAIHNASIKFPVIGSTAAFIVNMARSSLIGGVLSKNSSKKIEVEALKNLNLTISPGERVALVGHNGAGKSTFLRLVAGIYPPTGGSIEIRGSISSLIDINIGMHPEATGVENIYLRSALMGIGKAETSSALKEIIDFTDLGSFIELPLKTYSSGMQLRLAFAVATMEPKDILIMDEWLSVGDAGFKEKAENRLVEMVSRSKMLIIATHSRELIEKVCNRVIWLEHGQVKMDGPVAKVLPAYFG